MASLPPTDALPRPLFDALIEPVLAFDPSGRLQYANAAALRSLPCEPGMLLADLAKVLDAALLDWLRASLARGQPLPLPSALAAATGGLPVLTRLDARHWLLCLPPAVATAPQRREPMPLLEIGDAALRELHGMLWTSPFPVLLQDEAYRLIDVNQAYLALTGCSREALLGRDPLELLPPEDRVEALRERERLRRDPGDPHVPALVEQRLRDSRGQLRWLRSARYRTHTQDRRRLLMVVMQDVTAEHVAREQAERFSRELDQWFDLSPMGMALFEEGGLVLRANQAFEALVGGALLELRQASAAVRALLQWDDGHMAVALEPGGAWVASEGSLPRGDGSAGWVRALLRCVENRGAQRRIMCMLEDRTAEEERDMARLQLGALVDTAGVGLATLRGPESPEREALGAPAAGGVLQASVRRELVVPASLPEFERLQRALKAGERCEARYAIRHPELGLRWLVTRIEPGRLASGRPTTSVVTRDITDQHQAQERAEQLLAELSSILESSPAGIASMRGYTLMHCNRRFERMLRLGAGAAVGSDIRALLATRTSGIQASTQLDDTLDQGVLYEAEVEVPGDGGPAQWYALTIRRTGAGGEAPQAIAVLSEITRLKSQQVQLEALAREREQMAQVLGQQADRTRAVLDSVLVGIVTVDDAGAISWLNRSARRMFGGDLGDFLGQPIDAVATRDEYHPFRHSLELFEELRDGEAVKFECRVQGRDGRTFWVVGNAVATVGVSGARELTYALMDIEQRRQAEARIGEARASLQRIIEAAPMAITLFDAATLEVRQMNRVAAALCGSAAEAAVGRPPEQLYPAAIAARMREDLRGSLAAPEQVTQREYAFERAGQAPQLWEARYLPLARAGERVDQILLVASDVTAQRAAQRAELAAAIAQREMLVQEVHHRIKNNLQGVAGLLQQVGQRRPEVQPVITEVVGQVQAIAQVYGLQVGAVGPLQVRSVVEAIAQSVQRTFGRTIELSLACEGPGDDLPWTLPEAESIPIALTLNELLTNAIKHSPAGSSVSCRLVGQAEGVRVEIGNEGTLPPDFRIEHRPATVSGLGLVRALLPRRHASLGIGQRGSRVVAVVSLAAPVVARLQTVPAPAAEPAPLR
ncbi:MAG: PAS domain S-box protein [Burkholderiaceae bacterium]|nr:PAS domain S-box protein [Burkholderiaceae bacterium]